MHKPAPILPGDQRRVDFLRSLNILDTQQDIAFDRITETASEITHSPIALVSLVDGYRQWFKSKVGLDVSETSRDLAFCSHVIAQASDEIFVVCDALEDERFKYSDLVLGGPQIRFYAGAPLIVQGDDGCKYRIGTLCVIDRRPRNLEDYHIAVMESLARLVVAEIDKLRGRPNGIEDVFADLMPDTHAPHADGFSRQSKRAPSHGCADHGALPSAADTEAIWRAILAGHPAGPFHPIPATSSARSSSSPRSSFLSDADEDLWRSASDSDAGGMDWD